MKVVKMATKEDAKRAQVPFDFSDPETLLAVLEQIQNQKQPAIDRLTSEITERLDKLARLGEELMLIPKAEYQELKHSAPPPPAEKKERQTRTPKEPKSSDPSAKYDPSKSCVKCNGMAGHGSKAHNLAEGFKDSAFTEDELKKRGYWPPQ